MRFRLLITFTAFLICSASLLSQFAGNKLRLSEKVFKKQENIFADSLKKNFKTSKSVSAIFLGGGGGISVPLSPFNSNSDVTFGVLGRIEYSSYTIFPFVIGGEVTYFSYSGADEFKTVNLLSTFMTKILSFGLNVEYSLAKILRSSFTMPFLCIDLKSNNITREYDEFRTLDGLPREESKVSVGAGMGFTLFVFDFYAKYNYMKDNSHIGVYAKTKFPVIRF